MRSHLDQKLPPPAPGSCAWRSRFLGFGVSDRATLEISPDKHTSSFNALGNKRVSSSISVPYVLSPFFLPRKIIFEVFIGNSTPTVFHEIARARLQWKQVGHLVNGYMYVSVGEKHMVDVINTLLSFFIEKGGDSEPPPGAQRHDGTSARARREDRVAAERTFGNAAPAQRRAFRRGTPIVISARASYFE